VAFVGVDALSIKRSVVQAAREHAAAATGIPAGSIMVAASHTHNGGPLAEAFMSEASPAYCRLVSEQIAAAVTEAHATADECVLAIGSGQEDRVAHNRRFRMKDGTERTHPGKMNPDIVEPAGPIDPEVGVIGAFGKTDRRFLGAFVNYTCHCTLGVGGTGFSADYPYYLGKTIAGALGRPEAVVVFGNGACGDVTQVDNRHPRRSEFGEAWGWYVGTTVGAEAVKVLARVETHVETAVLGAASVTLGLTPRTVPPAALEEAERLVAAHQGNDWSNDEIWARELVLLEALNREEPSVPAEVQMLRVGPAALVSVPAEYFCQFGLEIKARSPWKPTCVIELANGCVGYVPGAQQVVDESGYEPKLARSSKLVPAAGQALADAAVELLQAQYPKG
jgi:hypothetical protein